MSDSRTSEPIGCLRHLTTIGAIVCVSLTSACGSKPGGTAAGAPASPDVWAVVDGREVRRDDVEKAFRRVAQPSPGPSEEEALTMKLSLLNELIVQDIMVAKARALKLEVTDAELDAAYADRRKNIPDEAFQQQLSQRGLTAADMRDGLRRELAMQKVLDTEVGAKVVVSDQDVTDFYNANRAQFNLAEPAYRIAQIVVTPTREPDLNNRKNDDATTPEAAARKAEMLMERLRAGVDFSTLAMDYSEDPPSAQQGGDLGYVPASTLKQVPAPLRDAVLKAVPGSVSKVSSGGTHSLVLLVSRESAGQRDLSMPGVRDGITGTLRGRRQQLLQTAYLTAARNDATVINYLARRLIETQGKMPTLAPAVPGGK